MKMISPILLAGSMLLALVLSAHGGGEPRIRPQCDPNRIPSCWVEHGPSSGPELVPVEPLPPPVESLPPPPSSMLQVKPNVFVPAPFAPAWVKFPNLYPPPCYPAACAWSPGVGLIR